MRSESSALSLHHIKTTVFTVVLVLPYISEPAERTGIGLCQQPFDSPLEVKNDCRHNRFGTPVYQRACRAYGNRAVLTAVRFTGGITKADTNVSAFWYSRVSASLSSVRESGRRNAVFRFRVGVKKTTVFTVVLVLPTGIEPITNP